MSYMLDGGQEARHCGWKNYGTMLRKVDPALLYQKHVWSSIVGARVFWHLPAFEYREASTGSGCISYAQTRLNDIIPLDRTKYKVYSIHSHPELITIPTSSRPLHLSPSPS